ncbi:MAG: sugar ABC transporter substrate-binding protein [Bacillati bacterium ANGP1]|uniref:Sugar ABC transporter substrate-binding protein n=1 Tax=Candidatus Segetimicrobium genomatis TaxID=2569760 RepID=A0A537J851_9BACT|nr:MAG: sugar ABC transporter substrate-binding protein [Terrabacteria group bacterium ANGP1]
MGHEVRGVSSLPIARRRVLFLVGAGATAALSGRPWQTARGQAKTVRIGAVTGNFSNPAVKQMVDAMQGELKKYPNAKFFVQDSANVSEQVAKAETMLGQGIDVLGLHPWDGKAIMPLIAKAHSKGVKVFLLIDDAPGAVDKGLAVSFSSANEVQGGRLLGGWLSAAIPNGGNVAIIEGSPGNYSAIYRSQGFKEGIKKNEKIKVVAEGTGNWQRDQGLRVATDMITANPDLAAIFAHNDEMAFGALQALKAANKTGKVILIGYNGTCIGIQAALKGDFQAEGILPIPQIGSSFIASAMVVGTGGSVPKRIEPPILALSTAELKAVESGSRQADSSLKDRIHTAAGGRC